MPDTETLKRVRQDQREGKAASTQAGEFIREEMHHIREGKHGARSAKQAIAIGLSKARRAGVKLKAPNPRTTSKAVRKQAARDTERAKHPHAPSPARSRSTLKALKKEPHAAASHTALARQAHRAAKRRPASARKAAARKAARTRAK